MEDFGKRIKELRTAKNFSQEAFAQMIGVHVTHLSRYERGKSVPSLEVAEKIASTLDISLDEMVYGQQNEKARTHITDNELLNLFNKTQQLSDDQKKTVMDLLSAFLLKANLTQELAH
jgi:transcriptional regulator with XRE-family HTH domain